ncbi:MAG: hypothetical protein KBF83_05380, partial [Pyrinomonadaceae bacterium]|nr:hypothetical protein [Pyrinomonadaceae bacterium]
MFQKTYYATHPDSVDFANNDDLRDLYLAEDMFADGEIRLNYTHYERMIIGGAVPTFSALDLPVQTEPASAKDKPFLERRELAAVNVSGNPGSVTVDGETFELAPKDGVY